MMAAVAPFVFALGEVQADPETIGSKAAYLKDLMERGVPIPATAVVPAEVYRRLVSPDGKSWQEVRQAIELADMEPVVRAVVEFARAHYGDVTLAVRSSSNLEDLADQSFAGQYESYLNVPVSEVGRAIKDCWQSLWSESAVAYRAESPRAAAMAVIIQPYISGLRSGVAFSANPVTGNPYEIVIDYAEGDCAGVTDGESTTTQLTVDVRSILRGQLPPEPFGTVCRVAMMFQRPVDLEWTMDARGHVTILQQRPIVLPARYPLPPVHGRAQYRLALPEAFAPLGASLELEKNTIYVRSLQRLMNPRYERRMVFSYQRQFIRAEHNALTGSILRRAAACARALIALPQYARLKSQRPRVRPSGRPESAVDGLVDLASRYLDLYRTSIPVGFLYNVSTGLLTRYASTLTAGAMPRSLLHNALASESTVATERTRRLSALAKQMRPTDSEHWLDEQTEDFQHQYRNVCEEYGYVFVDTNPRDPYARIDNSIAYGLLSGLAASRDVTRSSAFDESLKAAVQRRRFGWVQWPLFAGLLQLYRLIAPIKEDRNHLFYRAVAQLRDYIAANGALLARELALQNPDDVFFLTLPEIRARRTDPRRVALRRHLFALAQRHIDPHAIEHRAPQALNATDLQGIPCSPGRATGPIVFLRTREDFSKVRPGCVLVTDIVRPFWTPILGVAAGLLASSGSLLSHGASIAREYGLPAVFGLGPALFDLPEGQVVTIDGTLGVVNLGCEPSGAEERAC